MGFACIKEEYDKKKEENCNEVINVETVVKAAGASVTKNNLFAFIYKQLKENLTFVIVLSSLENAYCKYSVYKVVKTC